MKPARHEDIAHAIRGQLHTMPLGAPLTIFLARHVVKNSKLRKCQEPPRAYKNQKLTNADN